jgi:hypothetical protein
MGQMGPEMPTTTKARVHPALPIIPWSSQRRSFLSVNVAVKNHIGTPSLFRKGRARLTLPHA